MAGVRRHLVFLVPVAHEPDHEPVVVVETQVQQMGLLGGPFLGPLVWIEQIPFIVHSRHG
jgi:hypothetical protein